MVLLISGALIYWRKNRESKGWLDVTAIWAWKASVKVGMQEINFWKDLHLKTEKAQLLKFDFRSYFSFGVYGILFENNKDLLHHKREFCWMQMPKKPTFRGLPLLLQFLNFQNLIFCIRPLFRHSTQVGQCLTENYVATTQIFYKARWSLESSGGY